MKLSHKRIFTPWLLALLAQVSAFPTVTMAAGLNLAGTAALRIPATALTDQPIVFERNLGQYNDAATFVARGAAYYLAISPTELRVTLQTKKLSADVVGLDQVSSPAGVRTEFRALAIELVGADPMAQMMGEAVASTRASYFLGNDPALWRTGVPAYQRVRVVNVYPGINLLHYGNQKQLEYDFEIAPMIDPGLIAMRFRGAEQLRLDASTGELVIQVGNYELRQPKPLIYQTVRGQRQTVLGGYVLRDQQTVGFAVGAYDQRQPLIIDPVVSYSTLYGGLNDDTFWAIAVDSSGSIYLAGETLTTGLATGAAFQTNLAGQYSSHGDVIIAKFNNQLSATDYVTYLGGKAADVALGLAVDGAGSVYVTGYTDSTDFPLRSAVQTNIPGPVAPLTVPPLDLFVAKIGPTGSNLVFSTFYGGTDDDLAWGIALDANTNVYVVGQTISTNFPTRNTSYTNYSGAGDGFALKLEASGTNVIYAMYLGGTAADYARDVLVTPAGKPLVTGFTGSANFPVTTNALQLFLNHTTNVTYADDAFFAELNPASGAFNYSTFLGGTNNDHALRLAVDASGAAYLTGWTMSGDFPRTSTNFYTVVVSNAVYSDVFVTKLNPSQTNLDYSVTFGGGARDQAWDIAVDGMGRASVVGETLSLDFPTNALTGAVMRGTNAGGTDAFIAQLDAAGNRFTYSAYLGSPAEDVGYGAAVDAGGNAYFVGRTASASFPQQPDPGYSAFSDRDGFIVKMLADELPGLRISLSGTNANLSWSGLFPDLSVQSSTNLSATNSWVNVAGSPVLTNALATFTLTATNPAQFFRLKR